MKELKHRSKSTGSKWEMDGREGHGAVKETPEFRGKTSPAFSTLWVHPPPGDWHFRLFLNKNPTIFASELKIVLEFSWGEKLSHFLSTSRTTSMLFRIATLQFVNIYEFPDSYANLASLEVSYQFPVSSKSFLPWISLIWSLFNSKVWFNNQMIFFFPLAWLQ